MKKLKLLFLTLLVCMPFYVKAYGIENYFIDATVEENGDLLVQEYFNMTGEYNGASREINYRSNYYYFPGIYYSRGSSFHNGDGIEIIEIRAVQLNSSFDFANIGGKKFSLVNSASKGDYGVYTEDSTLTGKSLLIYNPSSNNMAFYIKYRIKNIAIKHNDVAELGWNIFNSNSSEAIGNFKLYLHIPGNTNVKAWAHGPLNGNVSIIDSENVLVTISNLSSYSAMDVRTTFDLSVINKSTKTTNIDALDEIILYEEDAAARANSERENKELIRQQKALEDLNYFEIHLIRCNYEDALESIEEITDESVKNEYLVRLAELKLLLDAREEEIAKESLEFVKRNPEYVWYYEDAKEDIEVLDNQELKAELLEELENSIKEYELNKEKENYFFGILILIGLIIAGIVIYRKYRKDPVVDFNQQYLRDFPSDYSPETVSYLFHKKVTNNAMSASMLDLVRKKIIFVEKLNSNNYKLTRNSKYKDKLSYIEERLIKLIFHGQKSVQTKNMKKYAKNHSASFTKNWKAYQNTSLSNAKKYLFYETDGKLKSKSNKRSANLVKNSEEKLSEKTQKLPFIIGLLLWSLVTLWQFISILISRHYYKFSSIIFIVCFIVSICLISFLFINKKRTVKGALEYKKWKAFENYLKDFGNFNDKEAIEVAIWEKYLVYATLFGCADKVVKAMKIKMVDMPDDYFGSYLDIYLMNRHITSSLHTSYGAAKSSSAGGDSSSSGNYSSGGGGGFSSGGGGGGGFSSGGGSFGGGGSVGRF